MILKAEHLTKTFGKPGAASFHLEIDDFEIQEGSFTAMLGPNGSGKSTFLKIILDLLSSDSGHITLMGKSHKNKESRVQLSYLPENFSFPGSLTVRKMLRTFTGLKYSSPSDTDSKIRELAQSFNVDYLDKKMKNLSKGMKQTAALMHTFMADDRFYILDEPFNGLDAVQKKAVMDYLFRLQKKQDISILITTHILTDIEKTCDSLYLIKNGGIIDSSSKAQIEAQFGSVEEYYLKHFETSIPGIS